jgi:hypothetical protein
VEAAAERTIIGSVMGLLFQSESIAHRAAAAGAGSRAPPGVPSRKGRAHEAGGRQFLSPGRLETGTLHNCVRFSESTSSAEPFAWNP